MTRRTSSRLIDLAGQRFGRLAVLDYTGDHSLGWLCRCDCGNEKTVPGGSLRGGGTRSCGCLQKETYFRGQRVPSGGNRARDAVLATYQDGALRRKLAWELTEGDFDRLASQPCFYCGTLPFRVRRRGKHEFTYNGIDRVDNDRGYHPDNVVTSCSICNNAKKNMLFEDFVMWILRVTRHQARLLGGDESPASSVEPASGRSW